MVQLRLQSERPPICLISNITAFLLCLWVGYSSCLLRWYWCHEYLNLRFIKSLRCLGTLAMLRLQCLVIVCTPRWAIGWLYPLRIGLSLWWKLAFKEHLLWLQLLRHSQWTWVEGVPVVSETGALRELYIHDRMLVFFFLNRAAYVCVVDLPDEWLDWVKGGCLVW